jgi:hypothetical protein
MPLPVTDTRRLFRPLCGEIVDLLTTLNGDDWQRPTVAGAWRVRDVVPHLIDTALRRLSFHRDALTLPPGSGPAATARDLLALVDALNATWVRAVGRWRGPVLRRPLAARCSSTRCRFVRPGREAGR